MGDGGCAAAGSKGADAGRGCVQRCGGGVRYRFFWKWSITTWPLTAPRRLDPVERKAPQESGPGRAAQTELAYSRSPWLWAPAQRLDRKGLAPVLVVFNAAMVACGICHQRVWGRGERLLAWGGARRQAHSRKNSAISACGISALAGQRRDGCARYRQSARGGIPALAGCFLFPGGRRVWSRSTPRWLRAASAISACGEGGGRQAWSRSTPRCLRAISTISACGEGGNGSLHGCAQGAGRIHVNFGNLRGWDSRSRFRGSLT